MSVQWFFLILLLQTTLLPLKLETVLSRQPFTPLVTHGNWRKLLLKDNNYWYNGGIKVNEEQRIFVSWFSMHLKKQIHCGFVYKCKLNAGATWPGKLMIKCLQKHLKVKMFFFETFLINYCVSVFQPRKCQNYFWTYSIYSQTKLSHEVAP